MACYQFLSHWCEPNGDVTELTQTLMPVNVQGLAVIPKGCNNSSAAEWRVWRGLAQLAGRSAQQCTHKAGLLPEEKAHFEAGGRACSSRLWTGLHSEGTCLSSNLTRLCLWLQTWQTHDYLTPRRGPGFPLFALSACQPVGLIVAVLRCEWPVYTTFVRACVSMCVCDISMATQSPGLPLGTDCWQRESSGQRKLCVCVAKVLALCRVHVLEAAAPVAISTGVLY